MTPLFQNGAGERKWDRTAMLGFLLRVIIVGVGLWIASAIVPGLTIAEGWPLIWAALLLGVINAVVRPIVIVLTLPLTVLTLGLFILIINAGMLSLVGWMLDGVTITSFWSAFFGAIVVSITGMIGSAFISDRGRVETLRSIDHR